MARLKIVAQLGKYIALRQVDITLVLQASERIKDARYSPIFLQTSSELNGICGFVRLNQPLILAIDQGVNTWRRK
jgi:hypothetical protein